MAEQSQTMTKDRVISPEEPPPAPGLQEGLPTHSLFPASGDSGRVRRRHHLLGRKKPIDASVAVLGMVAPTTGISTPSKKVTGQVNTAGGNGCSGPGLRIWLSAS